MELFPTWVLTDVRILLDDGHWERIEIILAILITGLVSSILCLVCRNSVETIVLPAYLLAALGRATVNLIEELRNVVASLLYTIGIAPTYEVDPAAALKPKLVRLLLLEPYSS